MKTKIQISNLKTIEELNELISVFEDVFEMENFKNTKCSLGALGSFVGKYFAT